MKPLGHSHVSISALIYFKFAHDVAYIMELFASENHQDLKMYLIQNGVQRIGPTAILDPKI